jgi:microcystin-dependent protein
MSEAYLGEIRMFGGNFAPVGWLPCNGQLLSIAENNALYSLLGTTYGGDGQTTFGLPDLRGRMPIHAQPSFAVGTAGGSEAVMLVAANLPAHSHTVAASTVVGTDDAPTGNVWANSGDALNLFSATGGTVAFAPNAIGATGGGQGHDNMMPFLAVTFMICLEGIYPSSS